MAKKQNETLKSEEQVASTPIEAIDNAIIEVELKTVPTDDSSFRLFVQSLAGSPSKVIKHQRNHYFKSGSKEGVIEAIKGLVGLPTEESIANHLKNATSFSLRTRQDDDGDAMLILKMSLGGDAVNGDDRIEVEIKAPLTIEELDELLTNNGAVIESGWSRSREEYTFDDMKVCIDFNAGYGRMAEIEKTTSAAGLTTEQVAEKKAKMLQELTVWAKENGLVILDKAKLGQMYKYYVENWRYYYGTQNTFLV